MEFTATSKAITTTAAGILISGFAIIISSVPGDNVAGAVGGACLIMVALTVIICVLVRHWVVNTDAERRILSAAQREAQAERTRYIAAQAALENEQGRLNQDMAAERSRIARLLIAERQKMAAEFEEQRAQLAAEAFRTGVEMERSGSLRREAPPTANLIPFPKQGQPAPQAAERERSREHGEAAP
ncbi:MULTISPECIES: hypothetical protein [Streptomyces]|uniref:hypothetical protein n=1 Tax=Streptomyces TaxID=1883 RepID=UPI00167BEAC4|nr:MULTISPECIES: hypothetical protein [Streptomyces]MBK3524881.1 hypothetical protein [Streptomyces sp. MBT70]GGR70744.1 hypothetical protein GCM10010236_26180 [Streptomyces eurythermus]